MRRKYSEMLKAIEAPRRLGERCEGARAAAQSRQRRSLRVPCSRKRRASSNFRASEDDVGSAAVVRRRRSRQGGHGRTYYVYADGFDADFAGRARRSEGVGSPRSSAPRLRRRNSAVYTRKNASAQDAHEAIRPTSVHRDAGAVKPYLSRDQLRLYKLIWERFVASQMASAVLDTMTVDIAAGGRCTFRASGSKIKFPGFMKVYVEGKR